MSTDACLTWIGGFREGQYFHQLIPQEVLNWPGAQIVHFEMVAIIVGLKMWGPHFTGYRFKIFCENEAVVMVLSLGKAWDQLLQTLLREVVFIQSKYNFEMVSQHISGVSNRTSDLLSRIHLPGNYLEKFNEIKLPSWERVVVPAYMFVINNDW